MRSRSSIIVLTAIVFALLHLVVVAMPVLVSGGSGLGQAIAAAIFDFPIAWLLGLSSAGNKILYGSYPAWYVFIFSVGGTLMYAAAGGLLGYGIHRIFRARRAA
jgi:hypothetical protein